MKHGLPQLIVFFLAFFAVCSGCKESKEEHFVDMSTAEQSHMIDKGWVPAFLPQDAKNISVLGDLDAGSVYGTYSSGDTTTLHTHCSNAGDLFRIPGYGPEWFRSALKEDNTAGRLRRKGYEVLQCEDGFNIVAVASREFGYYWSVRKR